MLWYWQANMERPQSLAVGGTMFSDDIYEVLSQVKAGMEEVWNDKPIYTGDPIVLSVRLEGKRAQ